MSDFHQFVRVDFRRFKAFREFALHLRTFNILIGPNNAGKSTILAAFRMLAAGMRKASSRKAEIVRGPSGSQYGHRIDLSSASVAEENLFYDYDDSEPATVTFTLSNGHRITLYFTEQNSCVMILDAKGKLSLTPNAFRSQFNCPIGFVPILGPVDHNENLFEPEAARLALFNYRAARNFRNIWYHYPEKFKDFRALLAQTWPGMDVEPPSVDVSHGKPRLHMFCPEQRIPREIFWSGFGFQVWCQMLTHLIQGSDKSIFLIDEPDIYLHSDLQRQLVGLLRGLGPDILIATHSTEMIIEAEPDELVLIDKQKKTAQRLREPAQLQGVFRTLGSNLNPVLTQLAKTRRVVFVEGSDFQIIGKFARKLRFDRVANRRDFAVVSVEGFNPDRIRSLKAGMEATLGGPILAAAVFDRDYRSDLECEAIKREVLLFCDSVTIHRCKEIENFLLVPPALERAVIRKIDERSRRAGTAATTFPDVCGLLMTFLNERKSYVVSQYLDNSRRFLRKEHSTLHDATINQQGLDYVEQIWVDPVRRLQIIPGKEAMGALNKQLQEQFSINLTPTSIIDAMHSDDIPVEMINLVESIDGFTGRSPSLGPALRPG